MATLMQEGYRSRLIESRLDKLMRAFGCVEIAGPKWCGKTWCALSRAASVTKLDVAAERMAAEADPALALSGETPHLVDEWQEVPEVWDAARRFVDDAGNRPGMLLLTGSTSLSPAQRERVRHSGAGRIARLEMRPMTLAEAGASSGAVSLKGLLEGEELVPAIRETSVEDIARWCCRGGWPANLGKDDEAAAETAAQYTRAVLDINVIEEGRSPQTAYALMKALALNESQAATYRTLMRDMAQETSAASDKTIADYLGLFERLYLIENLNGWEPPLRAKSRVRVKPKRYFADPSIAAALLGATPQTLLHDTQTLGMLFENLVIRDLRVFLSTYPGLGNSVRYYRDSAGLEVDVILEHAGRWAGIEIKLSDMKADEGAASLLRLRDKVVGTPGARNAEPAFLAVVVGRGKLAYRRGDGVLVLPAATLTA